MIRIARIRMQQRALPALFARFYAVGAVLWLLPPTRGLFVAITTPSLLLTIGAAFLFHRDWSRAAIGWFLFIALSAFWLEWAGVHDSRLFGAYAYGPGLAPLVGGTPLIIGTNWLWLVYASHDLAARAVRGPLLRIVAASLLMVGYDLALEWAAAPMRMWRFEDGYAPLRNFVVWFAASVIYHAGFEAAGIRSDNRTARVLFGLQMLFFLLIGLLAQLFPA
ncbi:carotenoid biosynthesis protein [Alistipes sp.]|uniref:carotenoid biosynthesis protein n=1 Tax=Alistipes sp. TaxID=1872444 RepID=UPI003AEF917B